MKKFSYDRAGVLYLRLFGFVKPFWPVLLLGIMANIIYSGIDAGFTWMMRPFLDKGLISIDAVFLQTVPFVILGGIVLRGFVSAMGSYCMTSVARSVVKVLRQKVFAHIIHLPVSSYDKATSGQFLSKILYDVEQVAQVSADALTDLVQNICLVIGLLTVMLLISWPLTVMFLITVPFVALLLNYTNRRVRRISHNVQKVMGEVTEIAAEAIEGHAVVRIFNSENFEKERFNQATEVSRRNDMKVAVSKAVNVFGVQFIIASAIAMIILAAIKLANVITITPGSFLAIIAGMLQLIKPMKTLTSLNAVIQRGLAGAESVFNLLDEPVESQHGKEFPAAVRGEVRFQNVSFAYQDDTKVLQKLNFVIGAGETVALVGRSGSGKTTIASLMARFYELSDGSITIDNMDISVIKRPILRAKIALVSQNVMLFNDTLANNIAYGQRDADRSLIERAARLAYADEFIHKLPEGYDTVVGENGVLLSGGQRQRIAIARAILKDAPILILDEATSALDNESEQYIQKALEQVMQNRTTLVIAHRLSTIKNANKIIVLHQGKIMEQGTHNELMDNNGYYAKLYTARGTTEDDLALELV